MHPGPFAPAGPSDGAGVWRCGTKLSDTALLPCRGVYVRAICQHMSATETTRRYLPETHELMKLALKAGVSERTVRRWYDCSARATWGNRARLSSAAKSLGIRQPDGPLPGNAAYPKTEATEK